MMTPEKIDSPLHQAPILVMPDPAPLSAFTRPISTYEVESPSLAELMLAPISLSAVVESPDDRLTSLFGLKLGHFPEFVFELERELQSMVVRALDQDGPINVSAVRVKAIGKPAQGSFTFWVEVHDPSTQSYLIPDLSYLKETLTRPFTTKDPLSPERFSSGPVRMLVDWSAEKGFSKLRPMIGTENSHDAISNLMVSIRMEQTRGDRSRSSALRYLLEEELLGEEEGVRATLMLISHSVATDGTQAIRVVIDFEGSERGAEEVRVVISTEGALGLEIKVEGVG